MFLASASPKQDSIFGGITRTVGTQYFSKINIFTSIVIVDNKTVFVLGLLTTHCRSTGHSKFSTAKILIALVLGDVAKIEQAIPKCESKT